MHSPSLWPQTVKFALRAPQSEGPQTGHGLSCAPSPEEPGSGLSLGCRAAGFGLGVQDSVEVLLLLSMDCRKMLASTIPKRTSLETNL